MLINLKNQIIENIWKDRYQKNNETLKDNLERVANFVGDDPKEKEEFFQIMQNGYFFPGGRTMSNAGIGTKLTLNNCFTAPAIRDDMDSIFDTIKIGALTHKAGGGIGYDFSTLRPNGSTTRNDAIASGAISFMKVFDEETATIQQGSRRGANMGVMSVYHPDIVEFITAKSTNSQILKHFNLSVMVDNDFMVAVKKDNDINLHFPVYDDNGIIIKDPEKWQVSKTVRAKDLWNQITNLAYMNGEPGVLFYDTMNIDNNLSYAETITHTNPCGEFICGRVRQDFLIFTDGNDIYDFGGACNLGSLYLYRFVDKPFTPEATVCYDRLAMAIKTAVKFLDNIIDINNYPIDIYQRYQNMFRTVGLGVTGLADMLVMLGLKYDSPNAVKFVDQLFDFIAFHAYEASVELSQIKGAFPGLNRKQFIESNFLTKHIANSKLPWSSLITEIQKYGIRNARLLSVAPVGTGSLVWGNNCSSGIEPIFSLEYQRKIKIGGQDDSYEQIVTMRDYAWDMYQNMCAENTVQKDYLETIKNNFITALNITPLDHVKMLEVIAKHVDMSVSKTINIPTEYSLKQVQEIYMECWQRNIKGCTIFRPNEIRQGILIDNSSKNKTTKDPISNSTNEQNNKQTQLRDIVKKNINNLSQLNRGDIIAPYDELLGRTKSLYTGCGKLYCELKYDEFDGSVWETWLTKGSGGGCERNLQFISRLMSLCLRGGIDITAIIDQALNIDPCPAYIKRGKSKGSSCPTAIGYALTELYNQIQDRYADEDVEIENSCDCINNITNTNSNSHIETSVKCPECGEPLTIEGGCNVCKACGYSSCGI